MSLFAEWRADRERHRRASVYVGRLMSEPDEADVAWLAHSATAGDTDHAAWELRYARWSMGLIAAQRDALDDLTASLVARQLAAALERDRKIAPDKREIAERQFNIRLSAYRDGIESRGLGGSPIATRMGQTLLAFAASSFRGTDEEVAHAAELLGGYLNEATLALRESFGASSLAEDVRPSETAQRR